MSNLEANREMHKVKIQVVQLQVIQGFVEAHRDVIWGMVGTPQLQRKTKRHPQNVRQHLQHRQTKHLLKHQMWFPILVLHPGAAGAAVLFSTHLTDDEHVLALDDALLHLGAQSFPNVHLIAVAVCGVYVAVASSDGCLYCALDWCAGKTGRLQQVKLV